MIQHEALPSDPDHKEVFEVPEELTIGVSAFIKIYQNDNYVGEAVSLEKIPNVSHNWALSRVILFTPIDFSKVVTIKTLLLAAEKLCYLDNEGWVALAFRAKPLQETSYVGLFSPTAIIRDVAMNNVMMYEHMAFQANKKGETL